MHEYDYDDSLEAAYQAGKQVERNKMLDILDARCRNCTEPTCCGLYDYLKVEI